MFVTLLLKNYGIDFSENLHGQSKVAPIGKRQKILPKSVILTLISSIKIYYIKLKFWGRPFSFPFLPVWQQHISSFSLKVKPKHSFVFCMSAHFHKSSKSLKFYKFLKFARIMKILKISQNFKNSKIYNRKFKQFQKYS